MTLSAELNQKAKAILMRVLGPVDYARFIQQYQEGTGDFTRARHLLLGEGSARPSMNKPPVLPQMANSRTRSGQNRSVRRNEIGVRNRGNDEMRNLTPMNRGVGIGELLTVELDRAGSDELLL